MNPISLSILGILTILVCSASRRWAAIGIVAGVLYLTQYSSVTLLGISLYPVRILEMVGIVRVIVRREFTISQLNQLDRLFLLVYSYATIIFLLRSGEGQAYQIGVFLDSTLSYFIFRGLIDDLDSLRWFMRNFVILLIPYVTLLFYEMLTHINPFSVLGDSMPAVAFREGRVRCSGSFRHPSILGSLGASFLPIYIGFVCSRRKYLYAIVGSFLCLVIVGLSNSGGPLSFTMFAGFVWMLWPFRDRIHIIRRAGLIFIIMIALAMKAPIWYLPAKLSFITGGDAWHRSYLIDIAMRNVGEWGIWGMPISNTCAWFPYGAPDHADITNLFISIGLSSGLPATILLISLFIVSFRSLGKTLAAVRIASPRPSESEYVIWGLCAMLTGHTLNFIAITYFDQFYVIWFMHLALISTLTHDPLRMLLQGATTPADDEGHTWSQFKSKSLGT